MTQTFAAKAFQTLKFYTWAHSWDIWKLLTFLFSTHWIRDKGLNDKKCWLCIFLFWFWIPSFTPPLSSYNVFSFYAVKVFWSCCWSCEDQILIYLHVSSPVTQVVFVVISCRSQSSPPTAGCGLSSAAAATGWEKGSLPFMRVSTHSATSLNSIPARCSADWTHGQSHIQQCA